MPNSSGMVSQRVPVLDPMGNMARPWFNLLFLIWQLTQNGRVTVTSTPFVMSVGIQYALMNVGAAASLTLPNVVGIPVTVKDISGNASAHNVTIHPPYGNIDGAATAALVANYQSATYLGDGSNWWII